jgi:1,4-alpha-glucan branching enzyme
MKKLHMSQENRITTTGFRRVGLDTAETLLKTKKTSESAASKINPSPRMQPVSERFPALEEQEIILTLVAPEAREVKVAGNFNGWRPEATPLKNTGAGEWVVRLSLRSGRYEYRFVVDGCWSEDSRAASRAANPYGGFNSVFIVPLEVRTSIL